MGRLAPEEGRSHYRVPDGVGFLALPHYARLSRPWTAVGAMARSLRRFWRLLGDVDVVWLLGPHPLAILFVLAAALRRKRVVLGVRQDFPQHMRTRHPGNRGILAARPCSWRGSSALWAASTRSWRWGRTSPAAIGEARFCR